MAKSKLVKNLAILTALALTLGCSVGPKYTPPRIKAPERWHSNFRGFTQKEPKSLAKWWTAFHDPILEELEEKAVKGNLNLKIALERIREARAMVGVERGRLFPSLGASASIQDMRESPNGSRMGIGGENKLYKVGFDSSWEMDIFGGIRSSVEASKAALKIAEENYHDVLVTLLAEVAINYANLRTCQARLRAVKENARIQEEVYQLNLSLYEAGLVDELVVHQSRYVLENTKSQIPPLEREIRLSEHRLSVLLGEPPGTLQKKLSQVKPIPKPPEEIAIGIPANTLRRRPDIRKAEWELVRTTANIRKAKAELYPKFNLSGTIGLESISTGNFWEWASRTWSAGFNTLWKIFQGGSLRKRVEAEQSRKKQAFISYRQTVLHALEEVEDALTAYAREKERLKHLEASVKAARKAYILALDRYKAGLVDFTDVLDAERSLQNYQDQLAESRGKLIVSLIRLYKALGGGWTYGTKQSTCKTPCIGSTCRPSCPERGSDHPFLNSTN